MAGKCRTIDPNDVPTVTFNLYAENILEHYNEKVTELRDVLTAECNDFVDGRPVTQHNIDNPVAKLNLIANDGIEGGMQRPGTAILVLKADFYGYIFFANGSWRRCGDCEAFDVSGAKKVHFSSGYGKFEMKTFGLGTILSAFSILNADRPNDWRECFLQLVFIFLEAARFQRVQAYVSGVIERAVESGNLYNHYESVDFMTRICASYWKKLSVPLQNYFRPMANQAPHWSIEDRVIEDLDLPRIESQLDDERLQEEQAQIQAALAFIQVLQRRM